MPQNIFAITTHYDYFQALLFRLSYDTGISRFFVAMSSSPPGGTRHDAASQHYRHAVLIFRPAGRRALPLQEFAHTLEPRIVCRRRRLPAVIYAMMHRRAASDDYHYFYAPPLLFIYFTPITLTAY